MVMRHLSTWKMVMKTQRKILEIILVDKFLARSAYKRGFRRGTALHDRTKLRKAILLRPGESNAPRFRGKNVDV